MSERQGFRKVGAPTDSQLGTMLIEQPQPPQPDASTAPTPKTATDEDDQD